MSGLLAIYRANKASFAALPDAHGLRGYLDGDHLATVMKALKRCGVRRASDLPLSEKRLVVDSVVFTIAERKGVEDDFRFDADENLRRLYGRIEASEEFRGITKLIDMELGLNGRGEVYRHLLSGMLGILEAMGKEVSEEASNPLDEKTAEAVNRTRREIIAERKAGRTSRTGQEWGPLLALTGTAVFIGGLLAAVVLAFQWEPVKPPYMGWPACTEEGQRGCVASVGSSPIADTVQAVLPRVSGATGVPVEVLAVYNAPTLNAEAGLFESLKVIVPDVDALPICPRKDGGYVVSEVTEPCVAMPRVDGGSTSGWHLIRWLESVGQDPQLLVAVNPGLAHRRFADGDEAKVIVLPPDMAAWVEGLAPT